MNRIWKRIQRIVDWFFGGRPYLTTPVITNNYYQPPITAFTPDPPPNPFDTIFADGNPTVEVMAEEAHKIWAGWMEYQFTKGLDGPRGQFTIDTESVKRWRRQMNTPYAALSEKEKTSDRDIARRYLRLIVEG